MKPIQIIILGIVQGLTEFLPISSSGHLVLMEHYLGVDQPGALLEALLHMGTLIAIMVAFWEDIVKMFKAYFNIFSKQGMDNPWEDPHARFGVLIIVGTIPTAIIGFAFRPIFEFLFKSILVVSGMLIVTGCILWLGERSKGENRGLPEMKILDALWVGFAQGVAIIPGISRSGTTIITGLKCGLNRKFAARFSFLLSIPAVVAVSIFYLVKATQIVPSQLPVMLLGSLTAAISGYIAIRIVLKTLEERRFGIFAWYCWIMGIIAIILYFLSHVRS